MKQIKIIIEIVWLSYCASSLGQILVAETIKKCKAVYFTLILNIIASLWAVTCDFLKVLSVRSPLEVKNVNVASILQNLLNLAWKIIWIFLSIRKRWFYRSEKTYTKYIFNSRLKQSVLTWAISTFFVSFSKTFAFIAYFE